ncbi:hypothetical protein [Marinoscillum sp.]|uniref:hypothetical protein n=1 Tax=Marinoscillum sp. TaxID=2024838 RepID=UPI003BACA6E1
MKWQQDHMNNNSGNINFINIDNLTIQFAPEKEKKTSIFTRISKFFGRVLKLVGLTKGNIS